MLQPSARLKVISRIRKLVLKHHFSVQNIDLNAWSKEVDNQTPSLLGAEEDRVFEDGVHRLLSDLRSSHTDFYRRDRNPIKPEHSIGATLRSITCVDSERWMFLDIFEDGPAALAGVTPGHLLISVDGIPAHPPELPTFHFGKRHELVIGVPNNTNTRRVMVDVPHRKSTRPRLPFVEPKSLSYRMLARQVGVVKVVFFPGMFGIRFSRIVDSAIESLKIQGCNRLIIDLRGCLGGSLGFARLASYMCPDPVPIGYDVTGKRQHRGYNVTQLPRVRMPDTRVGIVFRLAQFSVKDKSLVLLTQGLGGQPFHGRIAVLINEWTSSAAEMLAQFAKDTKLAITIGTRTAGLVLGSAIFDVGSGYTLYLPVFGWYSPTGHHTEGVGVQPDVTVDVDCQSLVSGKDSQLETAVEFLQ